MFLKTIKSSKILFNFKICYCLYLFSIFFLLNLFSYSQIFAQSNRNIDFEQRAICEKSNGLWREFGNACADDCYSKFDELAICSRDRNYSCDCGKGKCWNNEKCIAVLEYKKIYDEIKQQDLEAMSQAKRERIAKAQKYQQDLIKTMIENRSSLTVAKFNKDNVIIPHNNFSSNNYGTVYSKKYPDLARDKNFITNFDERYSSPGSPDENRLKSIQYQPKEDLTVNNQPIEIKPIDNNQINSNQLINNNQQPITPVYNQSITSNPNQNQQLVIQQPGMENQLIPNQPIQEINNQPSQYQEVPPPEFLKPKKVEQPVESFEIPMDFLKNKNNKENNLQLPVIELPR